MMGAIGDILYMCIYMTSTFELVDKGFKVETNQHTQIEEERGNTKTTAAAGPTNA